jgi:hypothetical protein
MPQGIGAVTTNHWGSLEPRVRHLEMEVADIKTGQREANSKLDSVLSSIVGLQANKPLQLPCLLDIATKLIILVAAFTTGVVYLARNGQSDELHGFDKRLQSIEQRMAKQGEPGVAAAPVTPWAPVVTKR